MRLRLIAAAAMLSFGLAAHADKLTTFNLTGVTLQTGSATGTITIDTTSGIVTAGNINVSNGTSSSLFNITDGTFPLLVDTYFNFLDSAGDVYQPSIPGLTLIDYTGSAICTFSSRCNGFVGGYFPDGINGPGSDYNAAGALTPVASTPEPSSLILLGTGALGAFAAARRRFIV